MSNHVGYNQTPPDRDLEKVVYRALYLHPGQFVKYFFPNAIFHDVEIAYDPGSRSYEVSLWEERHGRIIKRLHLLKPGAVEHWALNHKLFDFVAAGDDHVDVN